MADGRISASLAATAAGDDSVMLGEAESEIRLENSGRMRGEASSAILLAVGGGVSGNHEW